MILEYFETQQSTRYSHISYLKVHRLYIHMFHGAALSDHPKEYLQAFLHTRTVWSLNCLRPAMPYFLSLLL